MGIHKPKRIRSKSGLGANTKKSMDLISDTLGISTEIWGYVETPWVESGTIIAQRGYMWRTRWEVDRNYIVTKFYDTNRNLIGIYCDICRPVERDGKGFAFDDMYLDVWQVPGQPPAILDIEELQEAVKLHYVAESEARYMYGVAKDLSDRIASGDEILDF